MGEPLDPSFLERPYTHLLFKGLMSVYEKWVMNYTVDTLEEALKLVTFLPTDIKEVMTPKIKEITKDLRQAYSVDGSDFFLTHLKRNRTAQKIAIFHIGPFLDEMVRRLDQKEWLDRGALRARFQKKKKLGL